MYLIYFCPMEFFIEDEVKRKWHRVLSEDIIMCEEKGKMVHVFRAGKPTIFTAISIDGFHKKYLKKEERFIRTSSEHIVNMDRVISMSERKGMFYLEMEENNEALLRKSHPYAYMIQANDRKLPKEDLANASDQQKWIDKIITTYSDCNAISDMVFEKTGIKLTTRDIRQRYKRIKYEHDESTQK